MDLLALASRSREPARNRQVAALGSCILLLLAGCSKTKGQEHDQSADKTAGPAAAATKIPPAAGSQHRPRGAQVPAPDSVGIAPTDATRTTSGVAYKKKSKEGESQERPGPNDTITLNYTSWRPDGSTQFTSNQRTRPQKMSLSTTGPGWREAMQEMTLGETWLLWMTPQLAYGAIYGDKQSPKRPSGIITYEVELLAIDRAPKVPGDLAVVPKQATRTKSGLAYQLLRKGTGTSKPQFWDEVEFHFTGWTTEGLMVDSSVIRKRARKSVLFREMSGWNQGMQTMVAGESKRFWIPEPLTKTTKWSPRGMLIYDIELLSIKRNSKPWDTPANIAKAPASAAKTKGGIAHITLVAGTGTRKPTRKDVVAVNYAGWTTAGRLFDTSVVNGRPSSIELGQVMPGWTEGLETMVVGEKKRFWIPAELAYKGRSGPQGTLVFDIELVEIKDKPKPPTVPAHVAAPPTDAEKTTEGVYYQVLRKGTGTAHPEPTGSVVVHYAGWTTDGKLFDTSITRQRPSTISLNGVMKGWTIGLQKMVVGQKNRFWIPQELAYNGRAGKPKGMLVFELELLEIN